MWWNGFIYFFFLLFSFYELEGYLCRLTFRFLNAVMIKNLVLQMARELDAILDHGEANPAASCIGESGSPSFLEQIISPIYETMAAVSASLYCIFVLRVKIVSYFLFAFHSTCRCFHVFFIMIHDSLHSPQPNTYTNRTPKILGNKIRSDIF